MINSDMQLRIKRRIERESSVNISNSDFVNEQSNGSIQLHDEPTIDYPDDDGLDDDPDGDLDDDLEELKTIIPRVVEKMQKINRSSDFISVLNNIASGAL
ncbi:unnamed protein product [Owenia fusiformis]|uniref:Uncharacterized protein n=1 Tax=Owenia fusiformis TaxID=6347 RepID=A0A8J1U2N4_OWEFU|nr:unnamed protein product [Owenia fusiformis]